MLESLTRLLASALVREQVGGEYRLEEDAYHLGQIRLPLEREFPLGRYQWGQLPYRDPLELWDATQPFLPSEGHARVRAELENGCRNLELAYQARQSMELPPLEELGGVDPIFFEKLCLLGHNLHVGSKTRMGLSDQESRTYAAELGGSFEIGFVGVRQDRFECHGEPVESYMEVDLPRGYSAVPVHPFQREHILEELYAQEWEEGVLVDSSTRVPVRATTSFRTVVPEDPRLPTMKLAVESQMTSTVRSMSPQTVRNGPLYTQILESMELPPGFRLMAETGGMRLRALGPRRERNLCALLRSRITPGPKELAVVASSFISPYGELSLLGELVKLHPQGPEAFWNDYLKLVLPGHLQLLREEGIALEAHLQNCVVGFEGGRPTRIYVRDWGGLRIWLPRFKKFIPDLELDPTAITVTENYHAFMRKFSYCLFQNHLGEVGRLLQQEFGCPDEILWKAVRQEMRQHLNPEGDDFRFLTAPEVSHKALLRMRVEEPDDYLYVPLKNPLAEVVSACG